MIFLLIKIKVFEVFVHGQCSESREKGGVSSEGDRSWCSERGLQGGTGVGSQLSLAGSVPLDQLTLPASWLPLGNGPVGLTGLS